MPRVFVQVRWPDASTTSHTSPSTIVNSYFEADTELPLDDFVVQAEKAFEHASERVRERFGFYCSQASDSLSQIRSIAGRQPDGVVRVVGLEVER